MCKILIFGGTTEGRLLAEFCHENQVEAWVSVATGYGKMLLLESQFLHIHHTPMDAKEMEVFMREKGITLVVDATHPYAAEVSRNILHACTAAGTKRLRVLRESLKGSNEGDHVVWVDSIKEAIRFLNQNTGNVLATTGSKELECYTTMEGWEERVYARVLPTVSVLTACEKMGFKGNKIIGMQGPFSQEINRAMIRQYDIRFLVTKEAGHAGGFLEKLQAAAACEITSVVIGRPLNEEGVSLEEAKKLIIGRKPAETSSCKGAIYLIGTGMGGPEQMTVKALKTLHNCQVVFGAERILHDMGNLSPDVLKLPYYLSKDILPWLNEHGDYKRIAVLFSGDTGFYSGAEKMAAALLKEPYSELYETEILPGVSSVSYLCARLKTGWENVRLISLHGREWDLVEELKNNQRVFALLDKRNSVSALCRLLEENGYENARLSVGERLSYKDERITRGTLKTLKNQTFDILSAVLIER
ncbi:precorrin-6A reductase [Clostridium boliviensis]|uniref:Precorrin-6A reductase n=1 Tax=Clostridium boliviensis TaxID=318465 RepID=A0ABU4GN75_9CLOT|nr:precorrin-6A reductase [Clostridium boliviensis]MDW2799056.1 precorrin-6A reductase [Clostridium boliviensis]